LIIFQLSMGEEKKVVPLFEGVESIKAEIIQLLLGFMSWG